MTPGARAAAAIAVLDRVLEGEAAERALTNWARASRYAGSGDRAAVRDLVFDALRRLRSSAALGGARTGRAVIAGLLSGRGEDPAGLFTGEGHAPPPLAPDELPLRPDLPDLVALDCPDWLAPGLQSSLGADFGAVMQALRERAPVFLRVNVARTDLARARSRLAADGIETRPHLLSSTALEVTAGARRVTASAAYREGLVELQDAASQAVVEALPLADGMTVLDFCAGGGGKALAMAARASVEIVAHDADPARMADLPRRAARARATLRIARPSDLDRLYDLVLADAPCSGSGAWRRSPEAKWRLDTARLDALCRIQDRVLDAAAARVRPGGWLAYATCSLLDAENGDRVAAFLGRSPGWTERRRRRFTPLDGGDGFFVSCLQRAQDAD